MVTEDGLEDQLLAKVVLLERFDLAEQKDELIAQQLEAQLNAAFMQSSHWFEPDESTGAARSRALHFALPSKLGASERWTPHASGLPAALTMQAPQREREPVTGAARPTASE